VKFTEERPFGSVDGAVRKLLEIANGLEADHAGRLQIGTVNGQLCLLGGVLPMGVSEQNGLSAGHLRPLETSRSVAWLSEIRSPNVKGPRTPKMNRSSTRAGTGLFRPLVA
jgi:hypothetical protein